MRRQTRGLLIVVALVAGFGLAPPPADAQDRTNGFPVRTSVLLEEPRSTDAIGRSAALSSPDVTASGTALLSEDAVQGMARTRSPWLLPVAGATTGAAGFLYLGVRGCEREMNCVAWNAPYLILTGALVGGVVGAGAEWIVRMVDR